MKAQLNNYRKSPRKVRLVADMVRGKTVDEADRLLTFAIKDAAIPMRKLLSSALANAKSKGESTDNLVVKEVRVDGGVVLKRIRARARGSAFRIKKRTSHIFLSLGEGGKPSKTSEKVSPKKENKEDSKSLASSDKN
ncbi:MAG: 50S ribosomal protein L22 [Parcubacteria group bacterium CG11_big_fil_rev_8_21_14_0_20_39_22]|nr:MAG: 50S ribosomal protein L22 [Parcubacteria group bacterium CG11_big_fil_rev_8_21_14_0_20_39_22]